MTRAVQSNRQNAGASAGGSVVIGNRRVEHVRISIIDYDERGVQERRVKTLAECFPFKETPTVTWINVDGLSADVVKTLGDHYGLHPLVEEDILTTDQRPKFEEFEGYLFLMLQSPQLAGGRVAGEQLSLVVGKNFLLSFQETAGDAFNAVRQRIRSGGGRIRKMGPDYLAYALVDAIVDSSFAVLEDLGARMATLEDLSAQRPTPKTVQLLHQLKRELIFFRRAVWPLREVVAGLEHTESPLVGKATRAYLRDVYDHTVQVMETVETYRDLLSGILDVYLSTMSHRLNEVIKVLTIITTIFIPLSFIAGIYGMNFRFMPELEQPWGYPAVLSLMALVAGGMLVYFKRKRWM